MGEALRGQWLSHRHYRLRLGPDGLLGHYLVSVTGRPVCLYLPQALDLREQLELEPLFRGVARRKAWSTKRLKSVGNLSTHRNRNGTWSTLPRAQRLEMLRHAKEGTFGWRGRFPCAYNLESPDEYARIANYTHRISDLLMDNWPEAYERQMLVCSRRYNHLIGRTPWSQAVVNAEFYMSSHMDDGNVRGSLNAEIVYGDAQGGRLIIPRLSLGIQVRPGDVLFFDGSELHAVEAFTGRRMSVVWYLRPPNAAR